MSQTRCRFSYFLLRGRIRRGYQRSFTEYVVFLPPRVGILSSKHFGISNIVNLTSSNTDISGDIVLFISNIFPYSWYVFTYSTSAWLIFTWIINSNLLYILCISIIHRHGLQDTLGYKKATTCFKIDTYVPNINRLIKLSKLPIYSKLCL